MTEPTALKWSPQQDRALLRAKDWASSASGPQVLTMFGYAGTGKTTLARHLAQDVEGLVLFGAYTGKAASVLRRMGCPGASTIHSMLYAYSDQDRSKLHDMELEYAAIETEDPQDDRLSEMAQEIEFLKEKLRQPKFTKQQDSIIADATLVIIDECSMVNKEIGKDLESFGKKILVMGDPAQLPPIQGGGYYTSRAPDVMLTEIHRQAADNPIIRWATAVRNGEDLPFRDEGFARKIRKAKFPREELADGAQLLAGKNETRKKLNSYVREKLDRGGWYPVEGDRLVILRNDRDWGVLNGVVCSAANDALDGGESLLMDINYEGQTLSDVPVDRAAFDAYRPDAVDAKDDRAWRDTRWMIPADFGYCLTVHKAQGSQWDSVTVCDDGFGHWDRKLRMQWLYTAITRASHDLTILA